MERINRITLLGLTSGVLFLLLVAVPDVNGQGGTTRGCRVDICFVMDESGSIGSTNWALSTEFVSSFVDELYIGSAATRVGVVKFSSYANVSIRLDQYFDRDDLSGAIETLPYSGGGTRIHYGLQVAREQCFDENYGDRPDVIDILVLMTDGESDANAARLEALNVRNAGIHIISIGVGSGVDEPLLKELADNNPNNYFGFGDFMRLIDDTSLILGQSCVLADDCSNGQLTLLQQNSSFPQLLACPDLDNPVLVNDIQIQILCRIHYNDTDPFARYRVTFLLDSEDMGLSSFDLVFPLDRAYLDGRHLTGRLNRYVSCQVQTYYAYQPAVISLPVYSRSIWVGITPSVRDLFLREDNDDPKLLWFFSTLPIPCTSTGQDPDECAIEIQLTVEAIGNNADGDAEDVAIYQQNVNNLAELSPCIFTLYHRDWKANESLAYAVDGPAQLYPRKDPLDTLPRKLRLAARVLPSNNVANPFSDFELDTVRLELNDAIAVECTIVSDPWITTFEARRRDSFGMMQSGYFDLAISNSTRSFRIQARMFACRRNGSPGCSTACAVAVQEGAYAMAIDACNDNNDFHVLSLTLAGLTRTNASANFDRSGLGVQVTTNADRSEYLIHTVGGVRVKVRANGIGRGVDLYINVPARAVYKTRGLCGTFDRDPNNELLLRDGVNFDNNETYPNNFIESWRIAENKSLFSGYDLHDPNGNLGNIEENFCHCADSSNIVTGGPSLTNCGIGALDDPIADIANPKEVVKALIPNFILQSINSNRKKRQTSLPDVQSDDVDYMYALGNVPETFEGGESPPAWGTYGITEHQAQQACRNTIRQSPAFTNTQCGTMITTDEVEELVEECKGDVQRTGNVDWAQSRVGQYQEACIQRTLKQSMPGNRSDVLDQLMVQLQAIVSVICPNNCHGNGACQNGVCQCNAGYIGASCAATEDTKPQIREYQGPTICDVQRQACSTVKLVANDVVNSQNLKCKIDIEPYDGTAGQTYIEDGFMISPTVIECPLPSVRMDGSSAPGYKYSVTLTNNGADYSAAPTAVRAVVDSNCLTCDDMANCVPQPDTCVIDGKCYQNGVTLDECYQCDSDSNPNSGTLIPGDSPVLTSGSTFTKLDTDDISLQLTADDPDGNEVTFTLLPLSSNDVTVEEGGSVSWGPSPPGTIEAIFRLTSTGCPRYTDVTVSFVSQTCSQICGQYADCLADPDATPGDGQYTCSCPRNDNYCSPDPCENSGSCIRTTCGYVCTCDVDYTGMNCETELPPIGAWLEWSEYTPCSRLCDYGLQSRNRMCLREPCSGDVNRTSLCNTDQCPEDPALEDEGVIITFEQTPILSVSEEREDIRGHVAVVLNSYCQDNLQECCTSVDLRTLEKPGDVNAAFMRNDVTLPSGYPRRTEDRSVELKVTVEVDVIELADICDVDTNGTRRRLLQFDVRTVDDGFVQRAIEDNSVSFAEEFGFFVTARQADDTSRDYTDNVVIPAVAASCVIAVGGGIVAILFWKWKRAHRDPSKKRRHSRDCHSPHSHHSYSGYKFHGRSRDYPRYVEDNYGYYGGPW